jgi:hypothetical protein
MAGTPGRTTPAAAQALGLSARTRQTLRHPAYADFGVSIDLDEPGQFLADRAVTLDAVLLLDGRYTGTELHASAPLPAGEAAAAVAAHGYWMRHLPGTSRRTVMKAAFQLAGLVPVSRLTVPDTFEGLLAACRTAVREPQGVPE